MYCGKTIDGFEPAIQMLCENAGGFPPAFPDCASGRCFAFRWGEGWRECFGPLLSCPEAVMNLNRYGLIPGRELVCRRAEEAGDVGELLRRGAVIGPMTERTDLTSSLELYYHAEYRYIFAKEISDGEVIIHNPLGRSEVLLQFRDIACKIKGTYVISLSEAEREAEPRPETILTAGIELRNLRQEPEWERMSRRLGTDTYRLAGADFIALQYGLLYYLQQLQKVFSLAVRCGRSFEQRQMNALASEVYALRTGFTASELVRLDRELWRLIDEG